MNDKQLIIHQTFFHMLYCSIDKFLQLLRLYKYMHCSTLDNQNVCGSLPYHNVGVY